MPLAIRPPSLDLVILQAIVVVVLLCLASANEATMEKAGLGLVVKVVEFALVQVSIWVDLEDGLTNLQLF